MCLFGLCEENKNKNYLKLAWFVKCDCVNVPDVWICDLSIKIIISGGGNIQSN